MTVTTLPDKYTYIDSGITLTTPTGDFTNVTGVFTSPVSDLTVVPNVSWNGVSNITKLQVTWTSNATNYSDKYTLIWSNTSGNGATITDLTTPAYDIPDPIASTYTITVIAINGISDVQASPVTITYDYKLGGLSDLEPPLNPRITGTAGLITNSNVVNISWDYNVLNDATVDKLLDYYVEVFDEVPTTSHQRYTVTPLPDKSGNIEISYAEVQDIFGTKPRKFTLQVSSRDTFGDLSSTYLQFTIENPVPAAQTFTLTPLQKAVLVSITPTADSDGISYRVYTSLTSGGTRTLVYDGVDRVINVACLEEPAVLKYYTIDAYDFLGSTGLITSAEHSATAGATSAIASDIAFTPTGNLSSTNVQAALAELDSEKVTQVQGNGTVSGLTLTGNVTSTGNLTLGGSINLANATQNGLLTSTDWTTFNGKQATLVSGTSIKTINGASVLGSGDLTIASGVSSVTATSPLISSGGATPNINIATANSTTTGALTSTDWNTFNGKGTGNGTVTNIKGNGTVGGLTLSGDVSTSGNLTLGGSLTIANSTQNGIISSTDWNTFNQKGTSNLSYVQGNGTVNGLTLSGNVTSGGNLTLGGNLSGSAPNLTAGNVTYIPNLTGVVQGNSTGVTTLTSGGLTSSALATALTDETGSGNVVFNTSCTLTTPILGTPTSGNLTNCSGNATSLIVGNATRLQADKTIDGVVFNGTANITTIAEATHAATSKTTPVDADELPLVDSAASNILKKLTWANIKATLKTYFDSIYSTTVVWQTYSPTLGNITLGNGTVTAKYAQEGKLTHFCVRIDCGSTTSTSASAAPYITLPTTAADSIFAAIGNLVFYDSSVPLIFKGSGILISSTQLYLYIDYANSSFIYEGAIISGVPATIATGDVICVTGTYQTA
jgi:hypothetical protein